MLKENIFGGESKKYKNKSLYNKNNYYFKEPDGTNGKTVSIIDKYIATGRISREYLINKLKNFIYYNY